VLKLFRDQGELQIQVDNALTPSEFEQFTALLTKEEYVNCEVEFTHQYTLSTHTLQLLYQVIYIQKRRVHITAYKARLTRYLHHLGFDAFFKSQLQFRQINNSNIKYIIIGGSAQSGEKISQILSAIDTKRFAIFIVQHIPPDEQGSFDEILTRQTKSHAYYAKAGQQVKIGSIYIAPPDHHLKVEHNQIVLDQSAKVNYARPSISVTFESFSQEYHDNLLAILECGYAADGVDALATLKRNRSTIIIQDPTECEDATSIPKKAIETHRYDYVFNATQIINFITLLGLDLNNTYQWIEYLLDAINEKYDYDFRRYQQSSVKRRLEVFMTKHAIKDIKSLVILILHSNSAFRSLFLELSINVTELFRRPESFSKMIDSIVKEYAHSYNIKIWSAGCSSGEEVYSTAILLDQIGLLEKSIIYATDFNPVVIDEAKNGLYSLDQYHQAQKGYQEVWDYYDYTYAPTHHSSPAPLTSAFELNTNYIEVKPHIRKRIHFFVHNLTKDSTFNEFDIIECKNVLIYFDSALQLKVFQLFYDSLKFGGTLFLGESETIPAEFEGRFVPTSNGCKSYKKVE
jgi:chemotaxis protein methyltransferase CheR